MDEFQPFFRRIDFRSNMVTLLLTDCMIFWWYTRVGGLVRFGYKQYGKCGFKKLEAEFFNRAYKLQFVRAMSIQDKLIYNRKNAF